MSTTPISTIATIPPPYAYQVTGAEFLVERKRAILSDQMGLGKTRQALMALIKLNLIPNGKVLILCRESSLFAWLRQSQEFIPANLHPNTILVRGNVKSRKLAWDLTKKVGGIFVTTYNSAIADMKNGQIPKYWDVIIIDEFHRKMLNRNTQTHKMLKTLQSKYFWAVSGTPAKKGPQQLWPVLNVINPNMFSSYWKFVDQHCRVYPSAFGQEIQGAKDTKAFREFISQWMIRRLKKDVAAFIPPLTRGSIAVEMDAMQKRIYNDLKKYMVSFYNPEEPLVSKSVLTRVIMMRKLLVCPKLLNPSFSWGTGLDYIIEEIKDAGSDYTHFTIFTPFRDAVRLIQERLAEEDIGPTWTFMGGMSADKVKTNEEGFRHQGGVAIGTILFAEGYDLEKAQHGFFLGFEWDPHDNAQAEERTHRVTTSQPVHHTYIKYANTVDEQIIEILNGKIYNTRSFMQTVINS